MKGNYISKATRVALTLIEGTRVMKGIHISAGTDCEIYRDVGICIKKVLVEPFMICFGQTPKYLKISSNVMFMEKKKILEKAHKLISRQNVTRPFCD